MLEDLLHLLVPPFLCGVIGEGPLVDDRHDEVVVVGRSTQTDLDTEVALLPVRRDQAFDRPMRERSRDEDETATSDDAGAERHCDTSCSNVHLRTH